MNGWQECGSLTEMVSLTCIGNVFQDNFGFPIAKKFCKWRERGSRGFGLDYLLQWFQEYDETNCVLKGNVLQGDNGIHKNKYVTISDANKLYTHRYDKSY